MSHKQHHLEVVRMMLLDPWHWSWEGGEDLTANWGEGRDG